MRDGIVLESHDDANPMCGFSKREPGIPPGIGYQVPSTRHLGPDTRYRIDAEGRVPSTEDRARPPENAHTGYAIQPSSPSRPVQSSLDLPVPSPSRRGAWPTPVTSSLHHSVTSSLRHS